MKPHARSRRHLDRDNKPTHGKLIKHFYCILPREDFSEIEMRVKYWEWGWQWELPGQVTCSPIFPVATLPPKGPGCCLWEACSVPLPSPLSLLSFPLSSLLFPLFSLLSPLSIAPETEPGLCKGQVTRKLRPRSLLAFYYANTEVQHFQKTDLSQGLPFQLPLHPTTCELPVTMNYLPFIERVLWQSHQRRES